MPRVNVWMRVWVLLLVSAFAQSAMALCTSSGNADWQDNVWIASTPDTTGSCNGNNVGPSAGSNVVIAAGSQIKVDSNTAVVADVTINAGGTLKGKNNKTLSLAGNLTNNGGTFKASNGTVALVGATSQTISGTFAFANLTLNNPAGVTISGNVTVNGTFNPGTTPITVPAGSSLTVGGVVYNGPCSGTYGAGYCTAPTVTSITAASPNPATPASPVSWTVVFSTNVTGVTASNFALVQAGGVTGATITSVTGAGTTWTVNADTGTGTGTLGLNMINATGVSPALTNLPFIKGDVYTVAVVPPGTQPFDAVEVGGAIGSPIRTKIAGQAFNLDVLAVKNGAIDTGYKRTVTVDLIAGAALCGPTTPALAGVTVTPVPYQYDKAIDQGRHTFSFTSPDAYPNVRVRVQDDKGKIGCSYDNFAIRPSSLANLTVSDTDWTTAGARVLNNTSVTGPGCSAVNTPPGCTGTIHKAGQPFTVSATAVNAAAATTTNYVGTPAALLTACAGTACAAAFGTFSVGTAAAAGVINSSTATYSEVGSFALQLQDQTFANVDAADSTTAERYFASAVINVGRFVPDHFDTLVTAPLTCTGLTFPPPATVCPGNGLVYSGQPFTVNVYARNAAGGTTANYDSTSGLSKLVTLSAWDAPGSTTTQNPGGGAMTNNAVAATAFGAGIAITTTPAYSFNATPTTPTDIYLRALDADGVTSLRVPAIEGGVKVASGRIKISNTYGSELLQLSVAMTAQYWKDATSGWVTSSTDNSSSFVVATPPVASAVTFAAPPPPVISALGSVSVVGSPKTVTLVGGAGGFSLAAPGAGISGSVDMSIPAPGAGCSVAPVPLGCYLPSNSARATFGVYKGRKEFIYLRENY